MSKHLLAPLLAAVTLAQAAHAASLTPPNLVTASGLNNPDLLLVWPSASGGPLEAMSWSTFKGQMATGLAGSFLTPANNLSDLGNPTIARTNLGLGSAALQANGTSGAVYCLLNAACNYSGVQSFGSGDFAIKGATSGALTINVAAVAGSSVLTFPAGSTDFTGTGGAHQVVKQATSGGAFTVGQLSSADLSDGVNGSGAVVLGAVPTSWTPVLNFATAGTSSFSYASQQGRYQVVGGWLTLEFNLQFTPTVGTGSGDLQISLPLNCHDANGGSGVAAINGLFTWPASHTQLIVTLTSVSKMVIQAIGSAQNGANLGASNVSGGTPNHQLFGTFSCPVA